MRLARWARAAAFAIAVLASREAAAAGRRVLFVSAGETPFSARVRAEIEAMGFEIEPATGIARDASTDAIAAARVVEVPVRRVELWIADPSGHLTLRALVLPSPEGDEALETVRASEQLRAFFQPLRERPAGRSPPTQPAPAQPAPARPAPAPPLPSAPPSPHDEPPSSPAQPAPEQPPPPSPPAPGPRFVVGADVAVPFQPGGPGLNIALHGRWMPLRMLGVGAFVSVPLAGTTVKAPEGSASVSAPLFGADLAVVAGASSLLRLTANAGVALAWVRTSGFASPPYRGQPSNVAAALALLGAEAAPRITARTRLCFGAQLGVSLPRVDVAFAGRPVAVWGRPLGILSAGVSVDL